MMFTACNQTATRCSGVMTIGHAARVRHVPCRQGKERQGLASLTATTLSQTVEALPNRFGEQGEPFHHSSGVLRAEIRLKVVLDHFAKYA